MLQMTTGFDLVKGKSDNESLHESSPCERDRGGEPFGCMELLLFALFAILGFRVPDIAKNHEI